MSAAPWVPCALSGCAGKDHAARTAQHRRVLRELADEYRHIRTIAGPARLLIDSDESEPLQLDAAIAARLPDHFRLRAWKASHAVLDITRTPDGLWVYTAPHGNHDDTLSGRATTAALSDLWQTFRQAARARRWRTTGIAAQGSLGISARTDNATVCCELDAATGRMTACTVDRDHTERTRIEFDDYQHVADIAWPARIRIANAGTSIEIHFDQVSINERLPPAAFTPPTRAVRH